MLWGSWWLLQFFQSQFCRKVPYQRPIFRVWYQSMRFVLFVLYVLQHLTTQYFGTQLSQHISTWYSIELNLVQRANMFIDCSSLLSTSNFSGRPLYLTWDYQWGLKGWTGRHCSKKTLPFILSMFNRVLTVLVSGKRGIPETIEGYPMFQWSDLGWFQGSSMTFPERFMEL